MLIPVTLNKALKHFPHKIAVVDGDRRFTYRELAGRVYRLARYFQRLNLTKGSCVSILEPNSHRFLETYYAAAQLGVILNPLNIRLAAREVSFIVNDSDSALLISNREYRKVVSETRELLTNPAMPILWTGGGDSGEGSDYEEILSREDDSPVAMAEMDNDTVAHLYYTSGTTGKPKGVMLTHGNVTAHALGTIAELNLSDKDVWIHLAPMFHLADAWASFALTWVGGRHVMVKRFETDLALRLIEREKVTLTNMIPTMLNMLVNHPDVRSYDYSSLRFLLSGGAPIAPELVRRIVDAFSCDYIQTYGMTETSPYLTMSTLKEHLKTLPYDEQLKFKSRTGREFVGVELRVVDENGNNVAPDDTQVGEIIVKGDTVTPGYWRRPEETASAFKNGWLYTGDLATIDAEGYVNIVDRKKDMIITGGENVFSTEVEYVLYEHPAVLEVAVFGVPDPKWGEAVKAAVTLRQGAEATAEELIQFCKDRIAGYKAPKSVDFVAEIPKTGSGKIFKKGLRDKYWTE